MNYFSLSLALSLGLASCSSEEPVASRYKKSMAASADAEPGSQDTKTTLRIDETIRSTDFGLEANPNIDGKNLADIIMSKVAGRDDGQKCSACHNNSLALGGYWVESAEDEALTAIDTSSPIADTGIAWVGDDGWAERFVNNSTKPSNVKTFIKAWIKSGYR
ncbi:hypothetical protein [Pseudobacteriovorax antillogorgiicola]|uniref:Uncharacterized protein n=1 Tax=Pseudobacteriovorax antillogorgiicola TaxID=1513793 RepID=A0A1Y6CLM8_9BACT|nr:hypothetical protein [Pseudobacteriovorax antillogorgiicola]TCS47263.1 hypothetical protein EDD56_12138 [Pseudobacteriovorax antillogorgiicola]SMF62123.1 hypothetical protein SAMN06296036_12138 [Pseudobacteriovorax antillogorgiicola]